MVQQVQLSREEAANKVLAVLVSFASRYGEEMDRATQAVFHTALLKGEDYEWEFRGNAGVKAITYSASVLNAWFVNFTVDSLHNDPELTHDLHALVDDAVGDYFLNENDRKSRALVHAFEAWLQKAFDEVAITQSDRHNALIAIRGGRRSSIQAIRDGRNYTVTFHRPNPDGYIVSLTYPDPLRRANLVDHRLSGEASHHIIQAALGRIDRFPSRPY